MLASISQQKYETIPKYVEQVYRLFIKPFNGQIHLSSTKNQDAAAAIIL